MSQTLPRAEPRYFGPKDRPLFGWIHRPSASAPPRSVGVVICNPLGYEALCSHRSLRHFAEAAATLGFPTLRFDYDGTGDAAGDDLAPDRWQAWVASTREAIREVKRSTGVAQVCVLGVRLGAAIAVAASEVEGVVGLCLIAPAANGRLWLREMRAVQASMGRPDAPEEFALPASVREGIGVLFDRTTRDAIGTIDMMASGGRLTQSILLVDRSDRSPLTSLAERFAARGAAVTHAVLPGFVEMMLDAHFAVPPAAMIAAFTGWLEESFTSQRVASDPGAAASCLERPVVVAPGVQESLHFLGDDQRLFGILTTPVGTRPERAALLLNSGANLHTGSGRLNVKMARRLASSGWASLRYDASGLGDSLPHPGAAENEVYGRHALADLDAALRFLRTRHQITHIEAVGLCSGAYHAFKGAVAGLALDGVVVVNPLTFFWQPGMSLAYPPHRMVQTAAQYRRSVVQARKWRKLLSGNVDVDMIGRVVTHRLTDQARVALREVARALHIHLPRDLARELERVGRRQIAVRFLFSEGDPGDALLRAGAGSRLGWLERRGKLRIDYLGNCDHSLSCAWMHEAFWRRLAEYFDLRLTWTLGGLPNAARRS